ncbi:MAG: hypothetical protein K1X71_00200 [Pirellulales bacterium]|nr:hypothetical protein [Pirellulales bacterium]
MPPTIDPLVEQKQRDAMTFVLLGGFFTVMALLVLIGTLWTLARPHAMVVNLVAGLILLAMGGAMFGFGVHKRRLADYPREEQP